MTNNVFLIDVETRPDPAMDTPQYWQWVLNRLEPPGNIKDPVKIQAAMEEKVAKARAKMALSPSTALVPVIGISSWADDPSPTVLVAESESREAERKVLQDLLGMLGTEPGALLGFNIRRFDIPLLTFRFALHELELPSWWPYPKDYRRAFDFHVDLDWDMPQSELQYAWGGGFKEVEGPDLLKLSLPELAEHCREDMGWLDAMARRTYPIWNRSLSRI